MFSKNKTIEELTVKLRNILIFYKWSIVNGEKKYQMRI